ncbi:MAG: transcriptional regulator [Spirochaetae bacterium HGW-Spirochaetae-3]|jgi:DNA-binding MarR family transcriptional regulator|nr:MAG: transcriptional regulator [Spirochaetae bacterium HGW-Spirochaetae-3]
MNNPSLDRQASSSDDSELVILENIYSSQKRSRSVTQRDLAEAAGLSLGMTNALLKRFSDKGWVLLKRLNARNIQYALTPDGVNEIAHRTYRYFRRTAKSAGLYRDMIEAFVMEKKRAGASRLVLAGVSDLDFLIEYACERHGLLFVKTADPAKAVRLGGSAGTVIVYAEGETIPEPDEPRGEFPDECLSRVLVGVGPHGTENR